MNRSKKYLSLALDFAVASFMGAVSSNTNSAIIDLYQIVSISQFDMTNLVSSFLSIALISGWIFGAMLIPIMNKRFGNRNTIAIAAICGFVVNLFTYIPVHWIYWTVMRFILGIVQQIATGTAPVYLSTIAPPENKSLLNSLYELFISCGVLIVLLTMLPINAHEKVWWISLLYPTIITVTIVVLCVLSKNPPVRQQELYDEAAMQMDLLTSDEEPHNQVDGDNEKKTKSISMLQIFKHKEYRVPLIIAILLGFGSQITGINVFTIYITKIFEDIFKNTDKFHSAMYGAIIMAVFKVIGAAIPFFCMNRLIRKKMFLWGLFGCSLGNVIMAIGCFFDDTQRAIIAVIATIIYMLTFEFGPGAVTYVLYGEAFPDIIQNQLVGVAFSSMAITNVVVLFTFPYFDKVQWLAYLLYAIFSVGSGIGLIKYLPNK